MTLAAASAWWAASICGPAQAEERTASDPGVEQASYTTGEQGGRLKWLPNRGQAPMLASRAVVPARTARPEAPRGAEHVVARSLSQAGADPFRDPFGEGPAALRAPAGLGQLPTDPSRSLPAEPPLMPRGIPEAFPPRDLPAEPTPAEPTPAQPMPPQVTPAQPMPVEPMPRVVPAPRPGGTYLEPPAEPRGRDLPGPVNLECPSPSDPRFYKSIHQLTTDITPPDLTLDLPLECKLDDETLDPNQPRPWAPTTYTWKASGLCHKPLYFEQVHAERYGHSWGPLVQPVFAHAHFFLTVPVLPYKMGLTPPKECMYTLGYYRPGSCAPYMLDPLPLSVRAAAWQAGAVLGAVYVLP